MASPKFNKDQQILLCTDFNPKREGSSAHATFQLYFKCRTVGEFLAAGGSREAILWDAAHGYIILDWDGASVPTPDKVVATPAVTKVRAGVKVRGGASSKRERGADAFFAAEAAASKVKAAIAAKAGVRMENLIVKVIS